MADQANAKPKSRLARAYNKANSYLPSPGICPGLIVVLPLIRTSQIT